jgi:ribosomal protein S18 acetylase RimI-like enzyme
VRSVLNGGLMTAPDDADLYRRGTETVLASWEKYARAATGAEVRRFPGVATAIFPTAPERDVYNNALLERDLAATERAHAVAAMESAYAAAGVTRFAAWVHETDDAMRIDLWCRGYTLDASTRAMGMSLSDIHLPRPEIELGSTGWDEYLCTFGLPPGLLSGADHSIFHLLVAHLGGELVATAMAFDHGSDCGIYNVATLEHARRRGLATALTAVHLHDALARGCRTASVQSTEMAERVYTGVGFRDLGRILEYVPQGHRRTATAEPDGRP